MRLYQIKQRSTGAILWVGQALDEANALDAMAHEAGYRDAVHLPAHVRYCGFRTTVLKV